jgi:hypothetical protein
LEPSPDAAPLAEVLRTAAERSGLTLAGELQTLVAADLKPPPAAEPAGATEAPAAAPPAVAIPDTVGAEPIEDYAFFALATGRFERAPGQQIAAALFRFANAEDAWGLYSRGRGERVIRGLGQAAAFGQQMRIWRGTYAVILSADPPDPATDGVRLSKLGRDIVTQLVGVGREPEMVGWLPAPNLVPQSVTYFHANGPVGSESLALSDQTEAVAGEYRIGEETLGAIIVRYPDEAGALAGWAAFVRERTGVDPAQGTPGTRRTGLFGGRWNGARTEGRVCAFVIGAATRNQAETLLAQALVRASG